MGDDTPMPVLSGRPHLLYDYFKQRFAQVTNPAIDPLREGLVMSLEMTIGAKGNLLNNDGAKDIPAVHIKSPVLFDEDVEAIMAIEELNDARVAAATTGTGEEGRDGRRGEGDVPRRREGGRGWQPVRGALGQARVRRRGRCPPSPRSSRWARCTTTSSPWVSAPARPSWWSRRRRSATHHVACLVGYGASAVNPWLALETCRAWRTSTKVENAIERGKMPNMSVADVQRNFKAMLNAGLKKILSKMGISLLTSYHGAQIFECYGLGPELIDTAFKGTVSRVGGLNMDELAAETSMFAADNFPGEGR